MRWQIPVTMDSKHRITLPKDIRRKIPEDMDLIAEYDQGQPHVIVIVMVKKEVKDNE